MKSREISRIRPVVLPLLSAKATPDFSRSTKLFLFEGSSAITGDSSRGPSDSLLVFTSHTSIVSVAVTFPDIATCPEEGSQLTGA